MEILVHIQLKSSSQKLSELQIQAQDINEPKSGNIDFVQNYQLCVSLFISTHLPQIINLR